MLGINESAVTDAVAAISNQPDEKHRKLDAKAYSRAGSASYSLRRFADAASYFEQQNKLAPDQNCAESLAKTQQRIREQNSGSYDLPRLSRLFPRVPRLDVTDYLVNTRIGSSAFGEEDCRGLFATRDLQPGDLVIAEKACSAVWDNDKEAMYSSKWNAREADRTEARVGAVGLWRQTVRNAGKNPVFASQMLDLQGDYKGSRQDIPSIDGKSAVDT